MDSEEMTYVKTVIWLGLIIAAVLAVWYYGIQAVSSAP